MRMTETLAGRTAYLAAIGLGTEANPPRKVIDMTAPVDPTTTAACTELGWTVVPVAGGTGRDVAAALVASVGEAPAVPS